MDFKNIQFSCLFFPFLDSGANVILTTGGIDDLCLKYLVEAGAMVDANKLTSRGTYNIIYLYSFPVFYSFLGRVNENVYMGLEEYFCTKIQKRRM